jgi:glucose-6-phosphate isomerase
MIVRDRIWKDLITQAKALKTNRISRLFSQDAQRVEAYSICFDDMLYCDFSRQNISDPVRDVFLELYEDVGVRVQALRMVAGEQVNATEKRPALHMLMRAPDFQKTSDFEKMVSLVKKIEQNPDVKHIINIGIGGSSLGPELVCGALRPFWCSDKTIDFVSNIDGSALADALVGKKPENTLFIVASKSFKTQETLQNMKSALRWAQNGLGGDALKHFVAVTASHTTAQSHGIPDENILAFPAGVGGRYSVWSAIGLPVALMIGMEGFQSFLAGAHAMDQHFLTSETKSNLPMWLGMIAVWNHTFLELQSHVVCPYVHRLGRFSAYLQQLEMESLGKSVDRDGNTIPFSVSPVIWGEPGTDAQHSFFQHLHQGQACVSVDFIASAVGEEGYEDHHDALLANCFAQSAALMVGRDGAETRQAVGDELSPWCMFPGNRPSTTILCRKIDPYTLGALLALYEHKVFVQSVLWNINPFDQFGVEYGKIMAKDVLAAMHNSPAAVDQSTQNLLYYKKRWSNS